MFKVTTNHRFCQNNTMLSGYKLIKAENNINAKTQSLSKKKNTTNDTKRLAVLHFQTHKLSKTKIELCNRNLFRLPDRRLRLRS